MLAIFVICLELKFVIIISILVVWKTILRRNDSTSFVDEYVNLCVNELHGFVDENCSVIFLLVLCLVHKRSVMFHHSFQLLWKEF